MSPFVAIEDVIRPIDFKGKVEKKEIVWDKLITFVGNREFFGYRRYG